MQLVPGREVPPEIDMQPARRSDLDMDDALVAGSLEVSGHGRGIDAELTRDFNLAATEL